MLPDSSKMMMMMMMMNIHAFRFFATLTLFACICGRLECRRLLHDDTIPFFTSPPYVMRVSSEDLDVCILGPFLNQSCNL